MKSSRLPLAAFCWLLLLAFSFSPTAGALAQGTTAELEGRVIDEAGEPIPGANVVAVHQPTGTQYGAATNADGRYRILSMRVGGPYEITASFVGYQTAQETGVNLQLNQTRTIEFELAESTAELEEIRVVGTRDVILNENRTGAGTNVSEEQINELPTISRSLSDFARLTPQSSGGSSLAGRNNRYNSIQIDGATLDDVFGLGDATPGSQAGAQPISLDAIQEFNVDIAPYDVRSSGFTGGQINAITKSGTNAFEGSVRYLGRTQDFTGDLDGVGTGEFDEQYFVGTLGGPIIKDKLFFFANVELVRQNSPLDTRVGTDLGGPSVFPEDPATLTEIGEIAQSQYSYDAGGFSPLTQSQDNNKALVKLDWTINDANRLTLRHNYVDAEDDDGIGRGTDNFDLGARQYVFQSTQNSSTAQLNSTIGDDMFNEARLVYTRIRDERNVQDNAFPETVLNLENDRSVTLGIDRFSQANRLDQDLFEFTNDFTIARGDHTLTLGTNNQFFSFGNLFIQDDFGSYEFDAFTYEDEDGEEIEVSAIEAFRRGQPTVYRYSFATEAAGTDQPLAEFTGYQVGLYVQDEWQALENLKLTGGLRVDFIGIPDEPTENPAVQDVFGRSTTDVSSAPLFSPRLGFNYSLDGYSLNDQAATTQFRGGVGVFSGRPPFVWISNQFSNTGADLSRLDVTLQPEEAYVDEDGTYDPDARFFSPDPDDQPLPGENDALEPINTSEVNFLADGFRYPQVLRTNLGIDQELPYGFVATLEGIYSKSLNEVVFRNLNLNPVTEGLSASAYGRPLYGEPGGFRAASRNTVSDQFTNAIELDNSSEGYEYSLTAQVQRRQARGLGGSVSYTYNRAKNVNNGTSSRAISNWQFNENKDVNAPRLGTADFELRHRVLGDLTYRFEYAERFATSIGLIYEGRSGAPFSYIYAGDANADGQSFNDLVYVPASENEIFLSEESASWELLDSFIESEDGLNEARGEVVTRNTARAPWRNVLDLRINQEIATFGGQTIEASLNFLNVLNRLNDDWGRVLTTSFNNITVWDFNGYVSQDAVGSRFLGRIITQDDVGKPIITFDEEQVEEALTDERFDTANISSRWQVQLGVRYTF